MDRSPRRAAAHRPPRADGDATRARILDAAGQLYAELGCARTTSKAVCAAAGVNLAAVNYHFGSRDALYAEVLVEAHRRLFSIDDLKALAARPIEPSEQLAALVAQVATRAAAHPDAWAIRVLAHELLAPSSGLQQLLAKAILPKAAVMRRIVAAAIGKPARPDRIQRAMAFVMAPAVLFAVVPDAFRRSLLPTLGDDARSLADELRCFVIGGLDAIRAGRTASKPAARAVRRVPPRRDAA